MKKKVFTALGLMSGTSMDGVDLSIIKTDGYNEFTSVLDAYFKYDDNLHKNLTDLRDKIHKSDDLKKNQKSLIDLEKKLTIFHANIVNEILYEKEFNIDYIGFHGQTIYHNASEKISKQLGDGKLLSKLTKNKVVYNFRQKDLDNGGQGAPLTPIFHLMLKKKLNLKDISFINIGGIINSTLISRDNILRATDHGPGMCLVDAWIRKKKNERFDINGDIARAGKIDKLILNQALDNFLFNEEYKINNNDSNYSIKSFDINDFDISFVKGLSLEDGAATLLEFTAKIIESILNKNYQLNSSGKVFLCGGGRKNKFLTEKIKDYYKNIFLIDTLGFDGDFTESQAFGYLAIRSLLKLPISFPETTGCKNENTGGEIVENF